MHTTTTHELSCSVFGHNLERLHPDDKTSHELICKTCRAKVYIEAQGDIVTTPTKNQKLHRAFRQLFVLNSQYSRHKVPA